MNEQKERDYVKLEYQYTDAELYDEKTILKKMEHLKRVPDALPEIPGVNSIYGKLVLQSVGESIYKYSKEHLAQLIKTNESVLKQYSTKKKR